MSALYSTGSFVVAATILSAIVKAARRGRERRAEQKRRELLARLAADLRQVAAGRPDGRSQPGRKLA